MMVISLVTWLGGFDMECEAIMWDKIKKEMHIHTELVKLKYLIKSGMSDKKSKWPEEIKPLYYVREELLIVEEVVCR